MTSLAAPAATADSAQSATPGRLARLGDALRRHRRAVLALQWLIVAVYAVLVIVPALRPPPPQHARLWSDLTLFAQFAFWGIWWPFVIVSVMLLGRAWCGLLCPEGTLTEWASRHGLGRSIPRWLRWGGWAPLAFVATTVWGQLVSVYDYPRATLLILGGSTLVAMAVGFVWGRGTRVWCRYLCPVSGVFGLLARLAPLHYRVEPQAWRRYAGPRERVACAPLLDLRHLDSAADCHACGRCSGHRGAIALAARWPGHEIVHFHGLRATTPGADHSAPAAPAAAPPGIAPAHTVAATAPALLLLFGVLGVALGAFQWSADPAFIAARQAAVEWLLDRGWDGPLQDSAPWWLLTHEVHAHDVFLWLDGALILAYIGAAAALVGGLGWLATRAAARVLDTPALPWSRLALTLIPMGGASLFVGLSQMTLTQLRAEGLVPPGVTLVRALLLGGALAWSVALAWRVAAEARRPAPRRAVAVGLLGVPALLTALAWAR